MEDMKDQRCAVSRTGHADGVEPPKGHHSKAACRHKKGVLMGSKYKKRSRARKYTPRLQIVLSKSDYLPFFILFLTSNTSTSPDCGRFLTSASFPFSRISSIAFMSLSFNMILLYQILTNTVVSHLNEKRQGFPAAVLLLIQFFVYTLLDKFA